MDDEYWQGHDIRKGETIEYYIVPWCCCRCLGSVPKKYVGTVLDIKQINRQLHVIIKRLERANFRYHTAKKYNGNDVKIDKIPMHDVRPPSVPYNETSRLLPARINPPQWTSTSSELRYGQDRYGMVRLKDWNIGDKVVWIRESIEALTGKIIWIGEKFLTDGKKDVVAVVQFAQSTSSFPRYMDGPPANRNIVSLNELMLWEVWIGSINSTSVVPSNTSDHPQHHSLIKERPEIHKEPISPPVDPMENSDKLQFEHETFLRKTVPEIKIGDEVAWNREGLFALMGRIIWIGEKVPIELERDIVAVVQFDEPTNLLPRYLDGTFANRNIISLRELTPLPKLDSDDQGPSQISYVNETANKDKIRSNVVAQPGTPAATRDGHGLDKLEKPPANQLPGTIDSTSTPQIRITPQGSPKGEKDLISFGTGGDTPSPRNILRASSSRATKRKSKDFRDHLSDGASVSSNASDTEGVNLTSSQHSLAGTESRRSSKRSSSSSEYKSDPKKRKSTQSDDLPVSPPGIVDGNEKEPIPTIDPPTLSPIEKYCMTVSNSYPPEFGVQGMNNSCYMDATIFALFAFNKILDPILRTEGDDNNESGGQLAETLKKKLSGIVAALRKKYIVSKERMKKLRNEFVREKGQQYKSDYIANSYDIDAEEFIIDLFSLMNVPEFFTYDHGGTDYIHQILLPTTWDENQKTDYLQLQSLLDESFAALDVKLREIPKSTFIIKLPISDGKLIPCNAVVPNLTLDLCKILGKGPGVGSSAKMSLHAVVCLRSDRFTTFVRIDHEDPRGRWVFMNSNPHISTPEVYVLEDLTKNILEAENDFNTYLPIKNDPDCGGYKLFRDAFICIYVPQQL